MNLGKSIALTKKPQYGWRRFALHGGTTPTLTGVIYKRHYPTAILEPDMGPTVDNTHGIYFFRHRKDAETYSRTNAPLARVVGVRCVRHYRGYRADVAIILGIVNNATLAAKYGVQNIEG